ncbi:MAG TPA: DUF4920 domain-containing protein [Lunatimonas sp.]|nr:DUF4920 domain-containing protein [Lunatimonas sp.]
MKINYLVMIMGAWLMACQPQKTEITVEETPEDVSGFYGEKITEEKAVSIVQMHRELLNEGVFQGKVRGEIKEVCVNKGCWMTLALPDGNLMRVTFKDYGFFVPTNSQGYPVIVEGKALKSVTDVATLRHYAEDAGKSKEEIEAIESDEESFTFEATGVIISNAI